MTVIRDSGWEERRVVICPRCAAALKGARATHALTILLAGNCGHPEPGTAGPETTITQAWPPGLDRLRTRTRNALLRDGFTTLAELARCPDADLMDIPHFGVACLAEVHRVLRLHGLAREGETHENTGRAAS